MRFPSGNASLRIGRPSLGPGATRYAPAYLDGFRIAEGARHTDHFVPATDPPITAVHDGGDDYFDPETVLLLPFEGADLSTTITDASPYARTVTRTGTGTIVTAQFKYGTSSYQNANSSHLSVNAGTITGDFTIEFWARGNWNTLVTFSTSPSPTYLYNGSFFINGSPIVNATFGQVTTVWQHVCLMRIGSTVYFFRDGTLLNTGTSSATLTLTNLQIGRYAPNGNLWYTGQLDDFRISTVARYSPAGFIPPAAAHPTFQSNLGDPLAAGLVLLANADGADGSTSFTDESPSAHVLTANDGAEISTDQFKWTSSLYTGTGGGSVSVPANADFDFSDSHARPMSLDFNVYLEVASGWLFQFEIDADNRWGMYLRHDGRLIVSSIVNGIENTYNTGETLIAGVWYHVELVHYLGQTKVFVEGEFSISNPAANPLFNLYRIAAHKSLTPSAPKLLMSWSRFRSYAASVRGQLLDEDSVGIGRRLFLMDRVSGQLISKGLSKGDGTFDMIANSIEEPVILIAVPDLADERNAVIIDNITPVEPL